MLWFVRDVSNRGGHSSLAALPGEPAGAVDADVDSGGGERGQT